MRRYMVLLPALLVGAALAQAQPASTIILSDDDGRPMTIGSQDDSREALQPTQLSAVAAFDAFNALCLAGGFGAESYAKAAPTSELQLRPQQVQFEPLGRASAFTQNRLIAPGVIASWWDGNDTGLKNRAFAIRDRGAIITGGYSSSRAVGPQCNVSMKLAQAGDLQAVADHIAAVTGGTPIKIVVKPKWADGSWMIPNTTLRITFAVVDANKPASLVHFTVQDIKGAKP